MFECTCIVNLGSPSSYDLDEGVFIHCLTKLFRIALLLSLILLLSPGEECAQALNTCNY